MIVPWTAVWTVAAVVIRAVAVRTVTCRTVVASGWARPSLRLYIALRLRKKSLH